MALFATGYPGGSVSRNVSFFTTGYNYLVPVIPVFVVAHLFMWGQVEFGVITQSSMAFAHLMGAFSLIVTQFQSMSSYAAVTNRIRALGEALDHASAAPEGALVITEENGRLAYENVTFEAPDGRVLLRELSLTVDRGQRLLVRVANHRTAKAIFRATAGLSRLGAGRITRPDGTHILFLPERPYLPNDTLRELLPAHGPEAEHVINEVLSDVGLSHLPGQCGGLDSARDWSDVLSQEEQALLAAARALLAAPDFVYFDHPSSSIAPAELVRVFRALQARGIGCVCLGRAAEDPLFFDAVLDIRHDGSWGLHEVSSHASSATKGYGGD